MALQDLTPQLRTRLNRVERAVGWFVFFAVALTLAGFAYFLRSTAERKGWFLQKIVYQTGVASGAGLRVGDPVKLMGFDVGEITEVIPNDPYSYYNITIRFRVKLDHYNYPGYIWSDSKVRVNAGDLLGGRFLEITKGIAGVPTVWITNHTATGVLRENFFKQRRQERLEELKSQAIATAEQSGQPLPSDDELWSQVLSELNDAARARPDVFYTNLTAGIYFLEPIESPAVTERLQRVVDQVEAALPGFLAITNRINTLLDHSATLTSNLNVVAVIAQPAVSNFSLLTEEIRGPGGLGQWALGTNAQQSLEAALGNANQLLADADTNLVALTDQISASLENLASITSNLNAQVQANTNVLGSISQAIIHADELVQGLKRHWLLRSAFKDKAAENEKEKQSRQPVAPVRSPRDAAR